MGVYSIDALKSFYKSHFKSRDIDNTPTLKELIDKPLPVNESVEERMIKFYEEKEKKATEIYQKTLYR